MGPLGAGVRSQQYYVTEEEQSEDFFYVKSDADTGTKRKRYRSTYGRNEVQKGDSKGKLFIVDSKNNEFIISAIYRKVSFVILLK